jgi:hypothetical protein
MSIHERCTAVTAKHDCKAHCGVTVVKSCAFRTGIKRCNWHVKIPAAAMYTVLSHAIQPCDALLLLLLLLLLLCTDFILRKLNCFGSIAVASPATTTTIYAITVSVCVSASCTLQCFLLFCAMCMYCIANYTNSHPLYECCCRNGTVHRTVLPAFC